MAGRVPAKRDFSRVLESGASVDAIFKDSTPPLGSDPFDMLKNNDTKPNQTTQTETPAGESPERPGVTNELESSDDAIAPLDVVEVTGARKAADTPKTLPETELPATASSSANVPDVKSIPPVQMQFDPETTELFSMSRKLAIVEALFKLIAREYFSFGQLVSEVLRIAMEAVKCESGSFIEIDHQEKHLFFRAVTGRSSANLLNFTIPLGQGIAGFVCENQVPMVLSDVDESAIHLKSISTAVGFEAKNLAAYPIVIRGISFGCIELLNRLGEPGFTDEDQELLTTIAEYTGKVIENRLVLANLSKELASLKRAGGGQRAA